MLKVSEKYKTMAESDTREVSVKVVMGETVLTNDDIIELNIYRSTGESGFSIGGAVTTRVRLLCVMKLPYSSEVAMDVFVRFGFDEKTASDYVQLGHFYGHASNPSHKTAQVEIIGYDKLGSSGFNSRCTFAKVGGAELTFPCTVQKMLEYVCKRRNIETDFQCLDYTVSEMPVKDESKDSADYERYYTYKEIIGFIAAAHGASAAIDSEGKLVFLSAKESEEEVNKSDCIDFALTSAEKFTVKGILLHVQNVLSTGSTNIFINDDSKTAYDGEISEGVVETSCPFGSIEIAEALWGQLGGFSYNSCEFTRRGRGWTELGDIVKAVDDLGAKISGEYVNRDMVVQTVEWSFSADSGFMERIISKAENSAESAERLGSANAINNVSGGVGKFTNEAKNSEIFNDYENNYINPKTPYAHVSGKNNSIDKGDNITNVGEGSAVIGGVGNQTKNSPLSVVAGGNNNRADSAIAGCVLGGMNNNCEAAHSFIGGGLNNAITIGGAANVVDGGENNQVEASDCFIGAGRGNVILRNASYSTILGGWFNKIMDGMYNAILGGYENIISDSSYRCVFLGLSNKTSGEGSIRNSNDSFACGRYNTLKGAQSCIICGDYGVAEREHRIVVGGGGPNSPLNVFYVDSAGNVYAKSFNIIGETQSEASAFSARSADTPDLSELTAQISEIKADIEALRAENAALKAEIAALK